MDSICTEHSEAHSRPDDEDRLLKLYAARRRAKRDAEQCDNETSAAKRESLGPFILANEVSTVTFSPQSDGTVLITADTADHERNEYRRSKIRLPLAEAREKYAALLDRRYSRW